MFLSNLIAAVSLASSAVLAVPTATPQFIFPTIDHYHAPPQRGWNDIAYTLGNPVLTGDVPLYLIYYGDWPEKSKTVIEHFANNIGNSSWYAINKKYYFQESDKAKKVYAVGNVKVAKTVDDNYSFGKNLAGNALPDIIQAHVDAKNLPEDPTGVYFVLTAGDVKESIRDDLTGGEVVSFCDYYCGYHVSWEMTSGKRLFYSMTGLPSACLEGCAPQENRKVSPNNDPALDAMLSVFAHELVEAVSDPESDGRRAWQDASGYENADKCGWTYGRTRKDKAGFTYNMAIAGKNYMIQRNWDPEYQACRGGF